MGYMGFGMRKESYQRKPKKAFKRIEKVFGDGTDKDRDLKSNLELDIKDILDKPKHKSLFDNLFFKLINLAGVLFFMFVILFVLYQSLSWNL